MHTARSSGRPGGRGSPPGTPWDQTPPWDQPHPDHTPRDQAPPGTTPPDQAPTQPGTPQDQAPPGTTTTTPLWTEFLTHASENITLPQTSFAGGKYNCNGFCTPPKTCTKMVHFTFLFESASKSYRGITSQD